LGGTRAAEYELEEVDLFGLTWSHIAILEQLNRLRPAFPRRSILHTVNRGKALKRAHAMDMQASDPSAQRRRRAAFWERLARAMREQGVGGTSEAVTRDISYELRRKSAWKLSPEFGLLSVSHAFGHGTRILQPLLIWVAGAFGAALLLAGPTMADQQFLTLAFDLFTTPITFIRGSDSPVVRALWESGLDQRAIITGIRLLGFVCITYAAIAVRAYARIF
jgi:hypothetical protein